MIILIKWVPVDTSTVQSNYLFKLLFFFITATDTNYYHKIILNSAACPQNIYFSTFQRLFEKSLLFSLHQLPPPKYRGHSEIERWLGIDNT